MSPEARLVRLQADHFRRQDEADKAKFVAAGVPLPDEDQKPAAQAERYPPRDPEEQRTSLKGLGYSDEQIDRILTIM